MSKTKHVVHVSQTSELWHVDRMSYLYTRQLLNFFYNICVVYYDYISCRKCGFRNLAFDISMSCMHVLLLDE